MERSDDSAPRGRIQPGAPQLLPAPASGNLALPGRLLAHLEGWSWREPKAARATLQPFALPSPWGRRRRTQAAPDLLQHHHERRRIPLAAATDEPNAAGALSSWAWELGNPQPQQDKPSGHRRGEGQLPPARLQRRPHPNAAGQQERGSTAAHSKVISKPLGGCSRAPGRLIRSLNEAAQRPAGTGNSNRQVGDHRKGCPQAPHHARPSERWQWWERGSGKGQQGLRPACQRSKHGTATEEDKAKLCKAWVGSGQKHQQKKCV